jgi:hypothetical protein
VVAYEEVQLVAANIMTSTSDNRTITPLIFIFLLLIIQYKGVVLILLDSWLIKS